jgi:pimeloyl-ACP methyl ester carboxylesterase
MEKLPPRKKSAWRRAGQVGRGLVVALIVLGAVGATWNYLAVRRDREANPPPGRMYDVDGHAMHLYCSGTGSPTLVLESGHGEDFTVWGKVQPALSLVTRTCSYDRSGFGWSDPQPGARDAVHIADQLHALLLKAGITSPIVLTGHSGGGLYARVYASRFPQDIAGLILVDAFPSTPLSEPPFSAALDHHSAAEFAFVKATVALGVARLVGQCDSVPEGLETYAGWIKASECYYPQLDAYVREDRSLDDSRKQGAAAASLGSLPVLILSQDPRQPMPSFLSGRVSPRDWQWHVTAHDQEQTAYLHLSTKSRRVIAEKSGHYIQYDRPDVLIRETTTLIHQLATQRPAPQ